MPEGDTNIRYWKVSPGENAEGWDDFRDNELIEIGWHGDKDLRKTSVGDLTKNLDKKLIKKAFHEYYKKEINDGKYSERKVSTWAAIVRRFLEIKPRDKVVVYDEDFHINALAEVVGEYDFGEGLYFPHIKSVKWLKIFDQPFDIRSLKNKFKTKIWLPWTVIEMSKNDWDIIAEKVGFEKDGGIEYMVDINEIRNLLQKNPNVILYGPPGTGKTWAANRVKSRFKNTEFITFHQSYSYEDFIEGIKPKTDEKNNKKEIYYEVEDGIFKKLCKKAIENATEKGDFISKDVLQNKQFFKNFFEEYNKLSKDEKRKFFKNADDFLLIIDEINRGNISKIFGELITLIEKDKRLGSENQITVNLPYSKEVFGIPPNILLLGTMNTADRSIALLDVALRRRFDFYLMPPKPDLLEEVDGINLRELLDSLNQKIIELYDKDHQIGHSYFIGIKDLGELKYVWLYRVIPLLQEYFYSDNEKIEKIIGKEFLDMTEMKDEDFKEALLKITKSPKE